MPTVIIDSREKPKAIKNIVTYFKHNKIEYLSKKLDVGDYMILDNPHLVVDRKQNLNELSTNLCSNDRRRFYDEILRAKKSGIKLIILCEHGEGIKTLEDISSWRSSHSVVAGRDLMESIYTLQVSYGVKTLFCDKIDTGRMILEILTGNRL